MYECVWFGSGKGVCLAVSVVVEVTWDRGQRDWTERGEGSGVEEARIYKERVIKIITLECVVVGTGEAILPVPQAFGYFLKTDNKLKMEHHTTEDRQWLI